MRQELTMQSNKSTCLKLSILLHLLNIGDFVLQATGYSLKGCHITNVTIAKCDKSNLRAIPQDILPQVRVLYLTENNISRIRASECKVLSNLTVLNLKDNYISQIENNSFISLKSLEILILDSNRLDKLGDNIFHGLRNLTELGLKHNRIRTISSSSFQPLVNLEKLFLDRNRLSSLAIVQSILHHLPHLEELSIQRNDFGSFNSRKLSNGSTALKVLDISGNPIQAFILASDIFPKLTRLELENCGTKKGIKWIVGNYSFLRSVSTLDISGLQLSFDGIKSLLEGVNSSLTNLRMNNMQNLLPFGALINISCKIPSVTILKIERQHLGKITSNMLQMCTNVVELYIPQSSIMYIDDDSLRALQRLQVLNLRDNKLSSIPSAIRTLPGLLKLDLSSNNLSMLDCKDFAGLTRLRNLKLSQNHIKTLKPCLFQGLDELQFLKLQINHITNLGWAFRKGLPKLKVLYLNKNELKVIKKRDFENLKSLESLFLHENQIKQIQNAAFIGLVNIDTIDLQNNQLCSEQTEKDAFTGLSNLRKLNLMDNHFAYKTDKALPHPPFTYLSNLEELNICGQHHRSKSHLPQNLLQGLTNLTLLNIRNTQLTELHLSIFQYTPNLKTLYMSSNEFIDLSADLFSPLRKLEELYISRTNLRSLDFLQNANLTKLQFLQVRKNAFSVVSETMMKSLPALEYLDMQGNGFTCDCDNAWFLKWVKSDNQTQVFDAYNYECNYPLELKGMKILDFDIRSCIVDTGLICFISTTSMILLVLVTSFTYQLLRWQVVFAYYMFLGYLFNLRKKNRQAKCQYDAFISYNIHDERWVLRELLPTLEEKQGWSLCLHHRDFQPGKPIVQNITDAIYGSRKTICVISRRYLESDWCAKEIQAVSFRLFDEKKDVLILVFLEEIPAHHLSPYYSIRKVLKRHTYLTWPQAGQHTAVFWEKLRQALQS